MISLATVESGLIVNKSSVKTNMTPERIISRRMIKYHLLTNGLKPHAIEATRQLIKAFRSVRQKYMTWFERRKKSKEKNGYKTRSDIFIWLALQSFRNFNPIHCPSFKVFLLIFCFFLKLPCSCWLTGTVLLYKECIIKVFFFIQNVCQVSNFSNFYWNWSCLWYLL